MNQHNYTPYHVHTFYSLLDSCTAPEDYIKRASELGIKTFGFSEHGNIFNWFQKKKLCDEYGLKYLHGIECYITESLEQKIKDNWHTVLIAKNYQGFVEINNLFNLSYQKDHFYYKPRITVDEFLAISDNVIKISACIQSPLWQFRKSILQEDKKLKDNDGCVEFDTEEIRIHHKDLNLQRKRKYVQMVKHYDYYEIQYHSFPDNLEYTKYLWELSKHFGKSLIVGTDTHSSDQYKAECRTILQYGKTEGAWGDKENECDLTFKTYDELVEKFKEQNILPMDVILQAIENTNVMANSCEELVFDTHDKYPILYGEKDEEIMWDTIKRNYKQKLDAGIISNDKIYIEQIKEEMAVFKKVNMVGFMLFMSELMTWVRSNHISTGFSRGSVSGSTVAYITNITDVNPIKWNTIFSRFCNEHRVEAGDIDVDIYDDDRPKIYNYIINRFGIDKTAYILALGTLADKSAIAVICKALCVKNPNSPYDLKKMEYIKAEYDDDPEGTKAKYPEVFYYFDGLKDCVVSQSQHPAGIVASPMNLTDYCGTFLGNDGQRILPLDMDFCHALGLIKYDILGLKTIGVIDKVCKMIGQYFPKANETDFTDQAVYNDMNQNPNTIFQFESGYAQDCFKKMGCHSIDDITLVNAALRPGGASYRDRLFKHEINDNGSEIINNILKESYGFLVYQEEITAFLQYVCGFSGSDADSIRRAIGKKDAAKIEKALPQILEGYCSKSDKPREIAEQEAKNFLQVIEDASSYMFNKNHALGYSLLTYLCGYYRHYYPVQYCTAYLMCAKNDDDLFNGQQLARDLGITLEPVKFRFANWDYSCDADKRVIYKGLSDVPYMSQDSYKSLRSLYDKRYDVKTDITLFDIGQDNQIEPQFIDLLADLKELKVDVRQIESLIKLDYFSEFGDINYLLNILTLYKKYKTRKSWYRLVSTAAEIYSKGTTTIYDKLIYSFELTGLPSVVAPNLSDNWYFITEIKGTKYTMYQISTGKVKSFRIRNSITQQMPIAEKQIIQVLDVKQEGKYKKNADNKWIQDPNNLEDVVKQYKVVKMS